MMGMCGGGGGGGGTGAGPDGGLPGGSGPCASACDCPTGMACFRGQCTMPPFGAIYCCDSQDCPQGNVCQSSSGSLGQCGGGGGSGGGASDGGSPAYCGFIPCMSDTGCQRAGCGSCDPAKNRCQ
jgi:hypothetical protein